MLWVRITLPRRGDEALSPQGPHFIFPTLVYNKVSVLSTLSCLSLLTGEELREALGQTCVLGWGGAVFSWVLAEKFEDRCAVSFLGVSPDTHVLTVPQQLCPAEIFL